MIISFSLQQIQKTNKLEANLISRQNKLNLQAEFLRMKNENPKLKLSERANQTDYSFSALQRYRNDINMLSPYRIDTNSNNKRAKVFKHQNLTTIPDVQNLKRPQTTLNQLKQLQNQMRKTRFF